MTGLFRQGLFPAIAVLGLGSAMPVQAQFFASEEPQDTVIMIGNSPEEWSYYSSYWQQLLDLTPTQSEPPIEDAESLSNDRLQDPAYLRALADNMVVNNLRQQRISYRFGRSQVQGSITNRNSESVRVQGINFEIRDRAGRLVQTGSAVPQPNVLAPGQTVTFNETLLTVPISQRLRLQLLDPAVTVIPQSSGNGIQ